LDGNADNYNFIKQCNKRIEGVDDREEYEKLLVNEIIHHCKTKGTHDSNIAFIGYHGY
jgi:hypothetical protein